MPIMMKTGSSKDIEDIDCTIIVCNQSGSWDLGWDLVVMAVAVLAHLTLMLILQAVLLFRTWGRVHELWEAAGELEPWDLMHSWYQEMGRIPLALSSVLRGGGLHMGRRVWRNVEFNVLRAVFTEAIRGYW